MAEREQEVFLPEEVDEQIDEYLAYATMHRQAPDSVTEQTVQALQQHFVPAEDDAALQRVWQRFEQKQATMRKRKTVMHITIPQKGRNRVGALDVSYKKGHSLLTHRLNLAVAVFFVLLLVGSMAALFRLAPNRYSIVGSPPKEKMMFALANSTLYRLDMKTHQPLWQATRVMELGQIVGNTYYAITATDNTHFNLEALDVKSGKVHWQIALTDWMGQVIVSGNTVYFITQAKNGDITLIALDRTNGAKKWDYQLKNSSLFLTAVSDRAVYGEIVSIRNNKGFWQRFAVDAKDGKQLWLKDDGFNRQKSNIRGYVSDGVLLKIKVEQGTSEKGYFIGYDTASGKQLWSKVLWSKAPDNWVSVADTTLLNGIVYISTVVHNQGNSIYAFSAKDGSQLWHYQDTSRSGSSFPTVTENGIYINRYAPQTLVAIDPASGKIRWTYNFNDPLTVEYPPAADNNQVYLSLPKNVIHILRASDGKPLGSFKVGGKIDPNNRVIVQVV